MASVGLCCANPACMTTASPMWRKGWEDPSGTQVPLCNACGILYKRGWHCRICLEVYRKEGTGVGEEWISCDYCDTWTHLRCETREHGTSTLSGEAYACPGCRAAPGFPDPARPACEPVRNEGAEPKVLEFDGAARLVHARPFLKRRPAEAQRGVAGAGRGQGGAEEGDVGSRAARQARARKVLPGSFHEGSTLSGSRGTSRDHSRGAASPRERRAPPRGKRTSRLTEESVGGGAALLLEDALPAGEALSARLDPDDVGLFRSLLDSFRRDDSPDPLAGEPFFRPPPGHLMLSTMEPARAARVSGAHDRDSGGSGMGGESGASAGQAGLSGGAGAPSWPIDGAAPGHADSSGSRGKPPAAADGGRSAPADDPMRPSASDPWPAPEEGPPSPPPGRQSARVRLRRAASNVAPDRVAAAPPGGPAGPRPAPAEGAMDFESLRAIRRFKREDSVDVASASYAGSDVNVADFQDPEELQRLYDQSDPQATGAGGFVAGAAAPGKGARAAAAAAAARRSSAGSGLARRGRSASGLAGAPGLPGEDGGAGGAPPPGAPATEPVSRRHSINLSGGAPAGAPGGQGARHSRLAQASAPRGPADMVGSFVRVGGDADAGAPGARPRGTDEEEDALRLFADVEHLAARVQSRVSMPSRNMDDGMGGDAPAPKLARAPSRALEEGMLGEVRILTRDLNSSDMGADLGDALLNGLGDMADLEDMVDMAPSALRDGAAAVNGGGRGVGSAGRGSGEELLWGRRQGQLPSIDTDFGI